MTQKVQNIFNKLKADNKSGLVSFIMAGDPNIEATKVIIDSLINSGTNILEIGMPFSDPVADGVLIQESGKKALSNNVNLKQVLNLAKSTSDKYPDLPIILMGYFNPINKFGVENFCIEANKSGVSGVIIVDLPMEERSRYNELFLQYEVAFINLLSPNTNEARVKEIVKDAKGFIYYVSVNATTGSKEPVIADIKANLEIIKKYTDLPIAVGFGIKKPAQAKAIGEFADFIVVGSQYINLINENQGNFKSAISEFNKSLKASL